MGQVPWARAAAGANTYDQQAHAVLPTIYERVGATTAARDGINLGQGFPDHDGPAWMRQLAAEAITTDHGPTNQYPPGAGFPDFRQAVAAHQRRHYGLDLDPTTQVLYCTGATEGIAASILAFARPGSEVLSFEPFYDSYGAMVSLAGAHLRTIPLRAPDFRPDVEALIARLTDQTSMILLNSPHNPTGTVFTRGELEAIIHATRAHDVVIMCDEVYEHLVFDDAGVSHTPILTIPGALQVAVAVSSAGKAFSFTGWKTGWITASCELVNRVRGVKQFLTFTANPAYQYAVTAGLHDDRGFYAHNRQHLHQTRDLLAAGLTELGFTTYTPQAGYFILADTRELTDLTAAEYSQKLIDDAGVGTIPVSALTHPSTQDDPHDELNYLLRFAFCKHPTTLTTALTRLQKVLD
ncbi:aminotransferase class I/II-fold pyridoxal phosphate-dependent enzyme [Nesterenkonia alba]|uniref:aminotransferase class I/II-fold pyridoxal phosphate-dependent enzyme n=1 Tax=Nesterenkonia alba TaxID=515814 RepID=UPI0003B35273|nr:aminotransferase class I/II-fold pyridoxal phosphate-dependent enzyme [Nesterenkonia alba]